MMMDVLHGASGYYYEVSYKAEDSAAFTKTIIKDSNKTEFEIPAPGIYKKYIFKVLSGNDLGTCETPPKEVVEYSGREGKGLLSACYKKICYCISFFSVPPIISILRNYLKM